MTANRPADTDRDGLQVDQDVDSALVRRLDLFARTGDPAVLWPGLGDRERRAAAREIERVVRSVLRGETGIRLDPPSGHTPYALAIAGHTTGLGPVLGRWIEDGVVTAEPAVAAKFSEHLVHARARNQRIEAAMLLVFDALSADGVPTILLKGFHTARAYFPEPAVRRIADVDLFVEPEHAAALARSLERLGYRAAGFAVSVHKQDWIGSDVDDRIHSVELSHERDRWTIEVHVSLDRTIETNSVVRLHGERRHTETVEIASRVVVVPQPDLLLVMLASHCSEELGSSRLLRLYELASLIRTEQAAGRLRWDDVLAMLQRTDAARFVYPALTLVESLAPGAVDARVLQLGARASTWAARHTTARLVPAGGALDDRGIMRQFMWTRSVTGLAGRFARKVRPVSDKPGDVGSRWRADFRRWRSGRLTIRAPDERED